MSNASSIPSPLEFLIGRDGRGHWLVVETHGLAGGFFTTAVDAYRYIHSDFRACGKSIAVVDEILDPFGRTCLQIVDDAAAASARIARSAAA